MVVSRYTTSYSCWWVSFPSPRLVPLAKRMNLCWNHQPRERSEEMSKKKQIKIVQHMKYLQMQRLLANNIIVRSWTTSSVPPVTNATYLVPGTSSIGQNNFSSWYYNWFEFDSPYKKWSRRSAAEEYLIVGSPFSSMKVTTSSTIPENREKTWIKIQPNHNQHSKDGLPFILFCPSCG